MNRVFTDTSALLALFDQRDRHHARAVALLDKLRTERARLVLSDYIFDETVTTVLAAAGHRTAVMVGEFLLASKIIEMTRIDDAIRDAAWDFFRKHADKRYSFTDCTSFLVMKALRVNRYFSFDADFRQAGFVEYS
jgi:predicted nucleic acid-binding protein